MELIGLLERTFCKHRNTSKIRDHADNTKPGLTCRAVLPDILLTAGYFKDNKQNPLTAFMLYFDGRYFCIVANLYLAQTTATTSFEVVFGHV